MSYLYTADMFNDKWFKRLLLVLCLPVLYFPYYFISIMNLDHTELWKKEQVPYSFYNKMEAFAKMPDQKFLPVVSGSKSVVMTWYYYINKRKSGMSILQTTNYPCAEADFILWFDNDCLPVFPDGYKCIDSSYYVGHYLLQRKTSLKRLIIDSLIDYKTNGFVTDEFYNIWVGKTDTLFNKFLALNFDFKLLADDVPFNADLVISVDNKTTNLIYNVIKLQWIRERWATGENSFVNCNYISKLPDGAETIKAYLWNPGKKPYSISNGHFYLTELK